MHAEVALLLGMVWYNQYTGEESFAREPGNEARYRLLVLVIPSAIVVHEGNPV